MQWSKVIPVVLWPQRKPVICIVVSSSHGLSSRFHRSGPECSFTPLFVLWSVLALSRGFLCSYLWQEMHIIKVSEALISPLGFRLVEWERTLSWSNTGMQRDKHTLVRTKQRQEGMTDTHTGRLRRDSNWDSGPLAPAHASVQTGVNLWPFDEESA